MNLNTDNEDCREPSRDPSPGIAQEFGLLLLFLISQPLINASIGKLGISPDNTTSALLSQLIAWPLILWIGVRRSNIAIE